MNEELQKKTIEDMMKRPIPRKRVEIVKLQMIRAGSVLYGTRRFTSAEGAVEAVRPMLSRTDREMMLVMQLRLRPEKTAERPQKKSWKREKRIMFCMQRKIRMAKSMEILTRSRSMG